MTPSQHKRIHIKLHRALDALVADFINQTGILPSKITIRELMKWSYEQTINPTQHENI